MPEKIFKTKDLGEAAALLCSGKQMQGVEHIGKACWFIFTPGDTATAAVISYWNHQLAVDAQDFFHAINRLKQIIYSQKEI